MYIGRSLTVEIEASAGISEMEEQIQEAGHQAMRQALKQAARQWEGRVLTVEKGSGGWKEWHAGSLGRAWGMWPCHDDAFAVWRVDAGPVQPPPCSPGQEGDHAVLARGGHPRRVFPALSGGSSSAQETERSTRQCRRNPSAHNQHGQQRAAQQQEEAKASASASPEKPPMLVELAGGWVDSRERHGGMAGKMAVVCSHREDLLLPVIDTTFSWGKRGRPGKPPRQRHRLAKRRDVATFGTSRQIGPSVKAAAQELDADPSGPVVVMANAAQWIKREQGKHFPHATCRIGRISGEGFVMPSCLQHAPRSSRSKRDSHLYVQRTSLWLGSVDLALQGLHDVARDVPAEFLTPIPIPGKPALLDRLV